LLHIATHPRVLRCAPNFARLGLATTLTQACLPQPLPPARAVSASLRQSAERAALSDQLFGVALAHQLTVSSASRSPAHPPGSMPTVLSVDVGRKHLGFAIIQTWSFRILDWGETEVYKQDASYMPALLSFEQRCNGLPFTHVVIERQLGHRNVQAGRIEANLEAMFIARGKQVRVLPSEYKLSFHGLQLPNILRARFIRWEDEALARQAAGRLSKQQQTRLNKKMAKAIAVFFLATHPQTANIQTAYTQANKKDDMADALLQALAYANAILPEGVVQEDAGVMVID